MRNLLLSTSFYFLVFRIFSQDFEITQQVVLGGTAHEYSRFLINDPVNSGEYFLISDSFSGISGDKTEASRGWSDLWLVKLDSDFNILWEKTYGGSDFEFVRGAITTEDYLIIQMESVSDASGEKTMDRFTDYSWVHNPDVWLLCLDFSGNIIWQNQYGGVLKENASGIHHHSDSTFVMFITTESPVSGNKEIENVTENQSFDLWIVEARFSDGVIVNQSIIGSRLHDSYVSVFKTANGHYLLPLSSLTYGGPDHNGDKLESGYGGEDVWLVELDETFSIVQQKCFGGEHYDSPSEIIEFDNYYYLVASSVSAISGNKTVEPLGHLDIWLIKMDKDFNIVWQKTIGGSDEDGASGIFVNANGKLVVHGYSYSSENSGNKISPNYGNRDQWIVLVNSSGDVFEQFTIGGDNFESGKIYPHPTDATKLLFCNYTLSSEGTGNKTVPNIGATDIWLGVVEASSVLKTNNLSHTNITLFPNPASEKVEIHTGTDSEVWITDLNGRVLLEKISFQNSSVLNVENYSSGIYFMNVLTNGNTSVVRFVVE